MDVSECLSRAVEVTSDFYVAAPGAAAIWDRLSRRREFVKLRELSEVLNPQPAAQSVTAVGRVLAFTSRPFRPKHEITHNRTCLRRLDPRFTGVD
jgi:hypothetical protein